MAKHIRNMPVDYFEAKPQRAVGFDEFAGAVIPKDAPQQVRDILERRGVPYREYGDTKERTAVTQEFRGELHAKGESLLREPPAPYAAGGGAGSKPPGGPPATKTHPMPEPSGFSEREGQIRPLDVVRRLKAIFNPESLGPEARGTAGTIRSEAAARFRRFTQAEHTLRNLRKYVEKQPRARQVQLWDAYERGVKTGDPYIDAANRVFRFVSESRTQQLIATGRLAAQRAIQNYIGRFWSSNSNPKKAANFVQTMLAKRPFEGPKSFLEERDIEHFVDGLDAGLIPATYNYVESQLAKIAEMERLIESHEILQREQKAGRARRRRGARVGEDR
jgi:hypothetical protein